MKNTLLLILWVIIAGVGSAQDTSSARSIVDERMKVLREQNGQVEINSAEMASIYFTRATKCLNRGKDSVIVGFNILKRIYYFDSTSQLAIRSAHLLDSLHINQPIKIMQQLAGSWRWLRDGSNWGVANTAEKCKCEERIVFDKQKIHFFQDGREVDVYEYTIRPASGYYHADSYKPRWEMIYVIDIKGLNEQWRFNFNAPGSIGGAGAFSNIINTGLWVNRMLSCACGCPEEVYEKIVHY
ncbi:MAG TPA: hypothetical protein VHM26_12560 [Chitinophagaceae bacterium]|jgi:hypothetical protein|nr:hypothetical protein [Chitinophagaceae bacterium]